MDIDDEVRPIGALLLLVSAGVHLFLAHDYTDVVVGSGNFNGSGVSQGFLFYVVGAIMLALSIALFAGNSRIRTRAWSFGGGFMFVVLCALLAYRYGSPGAIGPIPDMSNSGWLPVGKPIAALAALMFVIVALARRPLQRRRDRDAGR